MTRELIRRPLESAKTSVGRSFHRRRVEPVVSKRWTPSVRRAGWRSEGRVFSSSRVESHTDVLMPTHNTFMLDGPGPPGTNELLGERL